MDLISNLDALIAERDTHLAAAAEIDRTLSAAVSAIRKVGAPARKPRKDKGITRTPVAAV